MEKKVDLLSDKKEVLDYKNLTNIAKAFKILEEWGLTKWEIWNLDETDLANFEKWYFSYRALYTYSSKERKLSKRDKEKFRIIEKSKWEIDIMNLVEIAIWRLLEKYFFDNWDYVRIKKTTTFDDVNSWLDYIIEFLDDNGKVSEIVGIDLTVSNDRFNLAQKKLRDKSKPNDYLDYISNREWKVFDFIPRLVLKLDKNLVYSFTNNYFVEIIEKWDILNNEELEQNFEYAINDLQRKELVAKEQSFKLTIQEIILDSKEKAKNLIS